MPHDKYPDETGRRRFVKGVLGSATLGAIGTGAASALGVSTMSAGQGGGARTYVGIENTAGPAPRGMPLIPIDIDEEGYLRGVWPEAETRVTDAGRPVTVAETEIAGITYSTEWFQYCGVQTYPALRPDAQRNPYLRSVKGPPYEWQRESKAPGEKLNRADFGDYEQWGNEIGRAGIGKPAMATWRSRNASSQETIAVQVLRSRRIERLAAGGHPLSDWLAATTHSGIVAWLDKCTHFCCVPRFKSYQDSLKFDAGDKVFCNCHQSVYDPFNPVVESFVALPRPR